MDPFDVDGLAGALVALYLAGHPQDAGVLVALTPPLGRAPAGRVADGVLIYPVDLGSVAHAMADPPLAVRIVDVDTNDGIVGVFALLAAVNNGRAARQLDSASHSRAEDQPDRSGCLQ
jgi:hypothetical protein